MEDYILEFDTCQIISRWNRFKLWLIGIKVISITAGFRLQVKATPIQIQKVEESLPVHYIYRAES